MQTEEKTMSTIFVHPLDSNASTAYIAALFEEFGVVEAVRIFTVGLKPKFAIVEMPFEESADRAIGALNGKKLDGRPVEVVEIGLAKLL
jgi:RNA recognition motif-containing protein